jgi:hypothetical protein
MGVGRTLELARPCCYARFVLAVAPGVPIETYSRRCGPCGITWAVRRETIGTGLVTDQIEWLDTTSRAFIRRVETR